MGEAILNFTVEFLIWAFQSVWSFVGLVLALIAACLFWYVFPEVQYRERWTVLIFLVTFLAVMAVGKIRERQKHENGEI